MLPLGPTMELVKASPTWVKGIEHIVTYDSWEQFLQSVESLKRMWHPMVYYTWNCKKENDLYYLQLIYLDTAPLNYHESYLHRAPILWKLLQRSAEIRFKETNCGQVVRWLIENNPDPWHMKDLTNFLALE